MIKLVEVKKNNKYTGGSSQPSYHLREVYINPQHIVCIREDAEVKRSLNEGLLPAGLDPRQDFSKIHLNRGQNGIDITVVGTPTAIESQLLNNKQLLKG